jgi:hypothetical protein
MEVNPGVFTSNLSAEEWQPDTDPPGEVHVLCSGVGLEAGLWRSVPGLTPEPVRWTLPAKGGDPGPRRLSEDRDRRWHNARTRGRRHRVDAGGRCDYVASLASLQGALGPRVAAEAGSSRSPSEQQNARGALFVPGTVPARTGQVLTFLRG